MPSFILAAGVTVLVDAEDVPRISTRRWRISCNGYVVASVNNHNETLHRFLLQPAEGLWVDHINGDRLDNRRCNLRTCTPSQNAQNRRVSSLNKTCLKGALSGADSRGGRALRFRARIRVNGKRINLGSFTTPEDAHRAYIQAATPLHKEFFHG